MAERLFKFTVPKPEYPALLARSLTSIRALLGEYEVVKVKQHWWLITDIHIWCKKVNKKDN
ncbi:MAG: hypothetical protein NC548_44460 [Lachnospiraceae bacterium]|nr:hypothetical protein [Lachnospiraceae bacterium]